MCPSGHFDPGSPAGCTFGGQKCSNVGCVPLTGCFTSCFLSNQADLCSPQANHQIMKCECIVCRNALLCERGWRTIFVR